MPFYMCTTRRGALAHQQKLAIAQAITRVHCQVTGAPGRFVHVTFHELAPGDGFVGGAEWSPVHSRVQGFIRAGRSDERKADLLFGISQAVSEITGQPLNEIVVAVHDVPARNIVEGGRLLPEPGEEEAWLIEAGLAVGS